jgi:hypothetical protein
MSRGRYVQFVGRCLKFDQEQPALNRAFVIHLDKLDYDVNWSYLKWAAFNQAEPGRSTYEKDLVGLKRNPASFATELEGQQEASPGIGSEDPLTNMEGRQKPSLGTGSDDLLTKADRLTLDKEICDVKLEAPMIEDLWSYIDKYENEGWSHQIQPLC